MPYEALLQLARSNKWTDLEREWLEAIEQAEVDPAPLLDVVDAVVRAGKGELANTMGWAWLSAMKDRRSPAEALEIGRQILVHLTDGDELRAEILSLYRETHTDRPDLEAWIGRSGLAGDKSVRRALRFLDIGLELAEGRYLIHRTDDLAARFVSLDLAADEAKIQTARRTETLELGRLIDEYDPADENDFRVLQQLRPARIGELVQSDPAVLVIGIARAHGNRIDRDALKLILVPRYLEAAAWGDWWSRFRNAVKKSPNLRIEGRSPMFVVYDPVGRSPEDDLWAAFEKAGTPREWLELVETYLRDCRSRKKKADAGCLDRVQKALVDRIGRFRQHQDPQSAFAAALVIERLAADGVPVSTDPHGTAIAMLREAEEPAAMVGAINDARLWPLAVACVEQAFADRWPEVFAELLLAAPMAQCDALAKKIEDAGRGALLPPVADRALAEPGRYTDALMWLWREPGITTPLALPPAVEVLTAILGLVGPARMSSGKIAGQTVNELRAKVRAGLSYRDYDRFRRAIDELDDGMALAVRRMIERAEGLGPAVQEDLSDILRVRFAHLYLRPKVAPWDDASVLFFTDRGLKARQDELDEIVNVKMRENAKAIGEAASHGDLSENSEYKFALEERDLLRARVAKLNAEISMARVLERDDLPTDHVGIGHRVHLRPTNGGEALTLTILGVGDGDLNRHFYSYQTPIARSLLGRKPGDTVRVALEGNEAEYVVDRFEGAI